MTFGFKIRRLAPSQTWLAEKKAPQKIISDYKMEILVKQGRDQFKKLIDKGISIPVALL